LSAVAAFHTLRTLSAVPARRALRALRALRPLRPDEPGLRPDPDAAHWGLVEVGEAGRIVRITGRGLSEPTVTQPRMFAGVHILHPRLLREVPKGKASSIIEAYVSGIQRNEAVLGYDHQGYWSDIGTPERYGQAEQDARSGRIDLSRRSLSPSAR